MMICFVSVTDYFCMEMKAMSGCEPNHESDTVCIHPAKNSVMDRTEIGSGGCNELHLTMRLVCSEIGVVVCMGAVVNVIVFHMTFRTSDFALKLLLIDMYLCVTVCGQSICTYVV